MPGYNRAILVKDPDPTAPMFLSEQALSRGAKSCLVWDHRGECPHDLPPMLDIMPTTYAPGSKLNMKKRKVGSSSSAALNLFAADESQPNVSERKSLRTLDVVRRLQHNDEFLKDRHEELQPHPSKKPCANLWRWQSNHFDLRHEEAADVRSPLQIAQDIAREEERKRHEAFQQHLREVAKYRAVNRIGLRHPQAPNEHMSPRVPQPPEPAELRATGPYAPKPPRATTRRPNTGRGAATTLPSSSAAVHSEQRPMSSRVRHRIASLADKFLATS